MPKRARSISPRAVDSGYACAPTRRPRSIEEQNREPSLRPSTTHHGRVADLFPFQEIFLRILSFLDPAELAIVQRVNKYWARMSLDPLLWKKLYLARYPHPHRSRLIYSSSADAGSTPRQNGYSPYPASPRTPRALRPIARLPSRAFPPPSPKRSPSIVEGALTPARGGSGQSHNASSALGAEELGHGVRNDGVDWKSMLRLGTNWSNGNALSQNIISLPPSPPPSAASITRATAPSGSQSTHSANPATEQHLALSPSYIFVSSPVSPLVQVYSSSANSESGPGHASAAQSTPLGIIPPPPGWSSPHRPDNITCIVADQSVIPLDEQVTTLGSDLKSLPARLAVFYQSGGFVILRITSRSTSSNTAGIEWKRESISLPRTRPRSARRRATTHVPIDGDSVVLAALHYPVLLSCTRDFHLSVYSVAATSDDGARTTCPEPRHLDTLHSEVSFHPAALSLFPASGPSPQEVTTGQRFTSESFCAALTYCTPLYPASWTVAVQELNIRLNAAPSVDPVFGSEPGTVRRGECFTLGRADDEDDLVWPRKIRPFVGVKGRAAGIGSDGRWCVLAGEDSQIQVYSLPHHEVGVDMTHLASSKTKGAALGGTQQITYSQTLLAHSTEITSLALSAGRCVSGGRDGRVLVWELDQEGVDDPVEATHPGADLDKAGDDGQKPGRVGRTVGYVEVRPGGRREAWRGAAGPVLDDKLAMERDDPADGLVKPGGGLPHPQAISSAARTLFLPRPPANMAKAERSRDTPAIRYLTFDEEKIVGLVKDLGRDEKGSGPMPPGMSRDRAPGSEAGRLETEVMKVWSFSG
ncbi:hypothetical protein IAU60_005250 [Kwoniella sp. DSM 27419]